MGHPTVRGTQSFVHTLSACWKRPSLTALEVLWRWAFGAPAGALIWYEATRILGETQIDFGALKRMTVLDPMSAAATLSQTASVLLPRHCGLRSGWRRCCWWCGSWCRRLGG
jgi:hypothetical protein